MTLIGIGVGIVSTIVIGGFLLGRFWVVPTFGTVPNNLGWREAESRFKRCRDDSNMPNGNCVSSTDPSDVRTYIEPISFTGTVQEAKDRILAIVSEMPRHTILANEANYLHVEFRSAMWGFPDDTEFYFDADNNLIHIRSAARLGKDDVGVNRKRVEAIRAQFEG